MPNVFEYQNYRNYLKDYYNEEKAKKNSFSFRYFSEKAGAHTPSFLFNVIKSKRNLTKSSIVKISQAIGHSREEGDYFENLVFFNQAETIVEKTHFYGRLLEVRNPIEVDKIETDRFEYYDKWYHSVLREAVTFFDFKDDFTKLGCFLMPSISAKEARDSVHLLERLSLIERDDGGRYRQTKNLVISRPSPENAFEVERFQLQMLRMAEKGYENIPMKNRMSTSTTFSISAKTFEVFTSRIREMQRELMEIAGMDDSQEQAFQMTVNLFPVSRNKNGNHYQRVNLPICNAFSPENIKPISDFYGT